MLSENPAGKFLWVVLIGIVVGVSSPILAEEMSADEIDLMVVLIRVLIDARFSYFNQVPAFSDEHGFSRAVFNANRFFTLLKLLKTHPAFLDFRIGALVFEFWHIKGTGDHAGPASHAFFFSPDHWAFVCLDHGFCEAG